MERHRTSIQMKEHFRWEALALIVAFPAGYVLSQPLVAGGAPPGLKLKTAAFRDGDAIPKKCTCDGADASPQLSWEDPPAETKSFALIVDDPDAPSGTWVHWVVFNLPAEARALPESVPRGDKVQGGGLQGRNDFPQIGYGGPCPPPGKPHRYFFKLYALDAELNLMTGATKADVEGAMDGHILAKAQLIGRYRR
jgi:Raf kinase inhibitor-like YbhB/YbcL family protein